MSKIWCLYAIYRFCVANVAEIETCCLHQVQCIELQYFSMVQYILICCVQFQVMVVLF